MDGVERRVDGADDALRPPVDAHVALLDINLNGQHSFPVADVIRARGLPFLFATGYGSRILGVPYRDVPILQKPFSLEELRRTLERIAV